MAIDADSLLRDALSLPLKVRANVAAELVASLEEEPLEDPEVVRVAWAEELTRRAERTLSGEDPGVSWSEVRDELRRSFP